MGAKTTAPVLLAGIVICCILSGCNNHMKDDGVQQAHESEQWPAQFGTESERQALLELADEDAREILAARARLLCETDHQALLESCRSVAEELEPGVHIWKRLSPEEIARFPQVIRDLRPQSVTFDRQGRVRIEMCATSWHSLGVRVYPEHLSHLIGGDRRLLEGLWYYDDDYRLDPRDHDRTIDAILRACGKL